MTLPGWFPTGADGDVAAVDPQEWVRRRLLDRRVVLLNGPLDDARSNEVGISLMTLDADGDDAVDLQIDSAGGSTGAALALMDIIDLLGVPVRAWCTGQAAGPAVGVLAVCRHRTLSSHARIHLTEPSVEFEGTARRLEQLAAGHAEQWAMFCRRLAEAAGQAAHRVEEDAARGQLLTAPEALAYGIVDHVAGPDAPIQRFPGRAIGFRPR